jgi:hypothetical protein
LNEIFLYYAALRRRERLIGLGVIMKEPAKAGEPEPKKEAPAEEKPVKELSAEEQMAQFEEDLKETDWGHQPC